MSAGVAVALHSKITAYYTKSMCTHIGGAKSTVGCHIQQCPPKLPRGRARAMLGLGLGLVVG